MNNKAVLMMTFLRLSSVKNTLEILKELEPMVVIITSDGPRNLKESADVEKVRDLIQTYSKDINIITLYSQKNNGILSTLYNSLDFVFNNLGLENIIFIEDDVIATKDYFLFCSTMLDYFKDNERIKVINGHNLSNVHFDVIYDYFFNKRLTSTAHAYWRRTYDELISIKDRFEYYIDEFDYNLIANKYYQSHLRTWLKKQKFSSENISYELLFTLLIYSRDGLSVTPKENLLQLGGIDINASNSLDDIIYYPTEVVKMFNKRSSVVSLPIKHPLVEDYFEAYDLEISNQLSEGRKLKSFFRKFRTLFLLLIRFRYKVIFSKFNKFKNRINKNGG
jgi:hypothetical protein